jgi:hypothetical protein
MIIPVTILCIAIAVSSISCASSLSSRSYGANASEIKGRISLEKVSVDKIGGGISVEREIRELLPLLFMEQGFELSAEPADTDAEYKLCVQAREREYSRDWKTERAVSLEVKLYALNGKTGTVPIAASRVVAQGGKSLSASQDLEALLVRAINETVHAIPSV